MGKNVEVTGSLIHCWKYSYLGNSWQFFIKLDKHTLTIWPSSPTPRYLLKKNKRICRYQDLYNNPLSSPIGNSRNCRQFKCLLTGEERNKLWRVQERELYSATKINHWNTQYHPKATHEALRKTTSINRGHNPTHRKS